MSKAYANSLPDVGVLAALRLDSYVVDVVATTLFFLGIFVSPDSEGVLRLACSNCPWFDCPSKMHLCIVEKTQV